MTCVLTVKMFSTEERAFLVEHVFHEGDRFTENIKMKFRLRFPNSRCPNRDTVRDLINKFHETGSVQDAPKTGRPTILTDNKLDEISDIMLRSPTKSMRKLAQETGISARTAHKAVTKELNLYPYKFTVVHELKDADYEKRLFYCEWFQRFINRHGIEVLDETFFTDEAWFNLSGYVNSQNSRIWSTDNPFALKETALHPEKIGVWVAISRARIVGPIFFETTVDSNVYCSEIIFPFIAQLNENEINRCFFQQDSATAHTSNHTVKFLNELFGERIISKGLWPPRSPDLSPPDYFYGEQQSAVYRT